MNQVIESKINKISKNNISKSIEADNSRSKVKKEEQLSKQKKIIGITSIGITGLSVLKLAPAQASMIENTIINGVKTFLNTKSVSFIGVIGIPNYLLIALVLFGIGISYFTFKDIIENKGKKVK